MRRHDRPHVIVALQLNGATGRNEFLGVSQFLVHGKSWNLTLANTLDDINGALARGDVDGAVIGLLHDDRTLALVAASKIPTVLLDIGADRVGDRRDAIAYVRNDDLGIGRMAADFFASRGQFQAYAFVPPAVPRPHGLRRRAGEPVGIGLAVGLVDALRRVLAHDRVLGRQQRGRQQKCRHHHLLVPFLSL